MSKEDFFEILNELDDNIVKRAKTPVKKKINWKIWGTMAACITVLLVIGILRFHPSQNRNADDLENACSADLAPMVYVNDTLYKQSSDQQGYPEWKDEFDYLGEIQSVVTSDQIPDQNFQANDPIVGCKVYQYGEHLVILINDSYWLYTKYGESGINWDDLSEEEKEMRDPMYHSK